MSGLWRAVLVQIIAGASLAGVTFAMVIAFPGLKRGVQ